VVAVANSISHRAHLIRVLPGRFEQAVADAAAPGLLGHERIVEHEDRCCGNGTQRGIELDESGQGCAIRRGHQDGRIAAWQPLLYKAASQVEVRRLPIELTLAIEQRGELRQIFGDGVPDPDHGGSAPCV
jgi:hypothetical protein